MSTQSYSSIGAGRRRGTAHDDIDRSFYTVGQTLASIVNDPRAPSQSGGFWGLASEATQLPPPPPLDPVKYPPVSKADLQRYIEVVHGAYEKFVRDRQSLEAFDAQHQGRRSSDGLRGSSSSGQQQGEPFMVAVQAVPTQFFQEGFFDTWDHFFKQYCQDQSAEELYDQIDLLNRNLDVVELQLLREVASRSSSFFQAASTLQGLQSQLSEAVGCIRGLRQELADADAAMYSTAAAVKALQGRRENLQDTLDITKGLEEVVATQQALDVMLENQDYAGALDLLAQLRALLQQPQLMGLQCLRHLPPRLMDMAAAVDGALANEFLTTAANPDVGRIAAKAAADAEAEPDASISPDGTMAAADTWHLTDPAAAADTAAADEQLTEELLPLAVGLYRSEALVPTLQQYKSNAGEEVKEAVREVVQQVLPVLLSACGDSLPPQGGGARPGEVYAWEQLQLLHHGAFMVLLYAAAHVIFSCIHHTVRVGKVLEAILAGINTPHSESVRVLKACGVAVQVAADVGLGRWVKLLNARSTAHTRLKQYELKQILDLSEQVSEYVESVGARPLSSFRMALQGQCKALLDASHSRNMTQLQGLLEAEQWVAVDVPAGFQAIVDRLLLRCAEGAALLDGREVHAGTPTHIRRSSTSSGGGASPSRTSAAGEAPATPTSAAGREDYQPVLHLCGKSFHLVNSALMLLKMVDEYMSLHDLMPQFGAEIVHRQLELLKLFNSQTAALVLGAGAMRTAGLRSISAKQLALSCQAIAMLSTLLQPLRAGCLALVSQPRRALLMPEYDRLLQDLTMHIDEVHSKLVDIMRDRLAAAMQALPAEVRAAAPSGGSTSVSAPTPTIALLTKQLATLRAVLVPLLLREEVEFVFGAVSRSYSDALSDTFETLLSEPNSGWEQVVQINALTMLEAFRELPLDPARSNNYSARLTTTYTKHFGLPPWDQQRLGHKLQQSASSGALQQQQQQGSPLPPDAAPQSAQQLVQQQQEEHHPAPRRDQPEQSVKMVAPEAVAAAAVAAAAAEAAHVAEQVLSGDPASDPLIAVSAPVPASNGLHENPADGSAAADAAVQQSPQDSLVGEQLGQGGPQAATNAQEQLLHAGHVKAQQPHDGQLQQLPQQHDLGVEEQQQQQGQQSQLLAAQQQQQEMLLDVQQADPQQRQEQHQEEKQSLQQPQHLTEDLLPSPQQQQQHQQQAAQGAEVLAHGTPSGQLGSTHATTDVLSGISNGHTTELAAAAAVAAAVGSQQEQQDHVSQSKQQPEQQQQQHERPLVAADRQHALGELDSSSGLIALRQPSQPNGLQHSPVDRQPSADSAAGVSSSTDVVAHPVGPGSEDGLMGVSLLSDSQLGTAADSSSDTAFNGSVATGLDSKGQAAAAAAAAAAPAAGAEPCAASGGHQGVLADAPAFMDAPPADASSLAVMDAPPAADAQLAYMNAPALADATPAMFMDAPSSADAAPAMFMDAPPVADAGMLSFMDGPPAGSLDATAGWESGGFDSMMDQLGVQQLGKGSDTDTAAAAAAAAGSAAAAASGDVGGSPSAATAAATAAAGRDGGAGRSSALDMLDAELDDIDLGSGEVGGSAGGLEAVQPLQADLLQLEQQQPQPQQQQQVVDVTDLAQLQPAAQLQQPQQQQQQQQQKPRYQHQRPEPEFYASLLQPESPFEQQDLRDTPDGTAAGLGAQAAPAAGTDAVQSVEAAGVVTANSWDPLGAVSAAPS